MLAISGIRSCDMDWSILVNVTDKIGGAAIEKLIEEVKKNQNYNKLDSVAGATSTSAGFRRAIRNAVKDIEKQN